MAYLLRLATNGYAQLASTFSVAGTSSLSIKFKAAFTSGVASEIYGLGTSINERLRYDGSGFFFRLNGGNGNTITTATIASLVSGYSVSNANEYELRKILFEDGSRTRYRLYVNGIDCGILLSIFGSGGDTFQFNRIGSASTSFFNGDLYYLDCYIDGVKTRSYSPDATGGAGSTLVDTTGGQNGTLNGAFSWIFYSSSASQNVTISAVKQQDTAAAVTVGTTQVLTVPTAKQQDVAATVAIGASQVLTVPAAKQQDTAAAVTIGTNQVLAVPATKQQDVAAAVSVAQVAPGSQPITVPAAKQQDAAGVVTVGTSQLITAAGTKQQDSASAISIGQSQIVSVAAIKQQDKAASVTVGTIQTLAVQPVTQTDTAARVAVGTTQLVVVPSVQQIDRAAAITLTQQPPITQTIDVRTLRIELTTPRLGVARNTPVYTAQLTTPRYTVARA